MRTATKIRLRKSERERLLRVKAFLVKVKEKMGQGGSQFWYCREEPCIVTAESIDPIKMQIKLSKNCTHCLSAGWGPYYDEEAAEFEEWFREFKKDFFIISPLEV